MPVGVDIIQFQVVQLQDGSNVVWALGSDGRLYVANQNVGGGAWREYEAGR